MTEPNYHAIALNNARVLETFSRVLDKRNREIAELKQKLKEYEEREDDAT